MHPVSDSNSVAEQRVAQQRCIDFSHVGTPSHFDGTANIHTSDRQAINYHNYYPRARLTTTSVPLKSHLPGTEHSKCNCCPTQPIGWRIAEPDISQMSATNELHLYENVAAVNPEVQVDGSEPTYASPPSPTLIEIQKRLNQKPRCGSFCLLKPYSKVLRIWLSLVSLAVLYNLWLPIARQSFYKIQTRYFLFWLVLDAVADFIYLLDIFMQMGTTYLEYGIPVLKRRKIAKYYMKTVGFRLDLLSLLPLDLIQIKVGTQPMLRFPRFIKLHRFLEWKMSIGHLCRIPSIWRLFHSLHLLFLGCHWCACLYFDISAFEQFKSTWGFVPHDGSNTTLFRVYLVSFYWATLALTTIGIEEPPTTNLEFIFTCLAYLFGLFVFATVVGQVGSIINSQNAARVAFEEVLDNVKNYMRLHSVRDDLQSRILRWYDYAWQKKSMNGVLDVASLEMLPEKLKTELVMDVNYETLRKIAIFKECRPEFLHDLVLKMRPILFTPGDYVCRKGEIAREMFIIADGVLEVLGPNNEVLAMMASGDMFGEIGVLRIEGQNKRTADVRAVGYTELYVLSRDDIMEALEDHPEAEMFMKDAARRRLYGSGGGPRPRRSLSASQYQGPSTSTQETRKLEIGFRTSERQSHIEANISDLVSQVESTRVKNTLENFSKTWQTLLKDLVQAYEDEIKQLRQELDERRS